LKFERMQVAVLRHLNVVKVFPGGCFLGREETLERKKAGPLGFRTKPWEVA
jgi:hypothetical protein